MTRFTRFTLFSLALLVAVTAQHMAMARAVMMDAQGQVVLCTGQGVVTVTLDSQGNPIEPAYFCPDCALSFVVHHAGETASAAVVIHMQTLVQTPVKDAKVLMVAGVSNARDPPLWT